MIPRKAGKRPRARLDQAAYREHNRVERGIRLLKQHWTIAAHCQRQAVQYHPLLTITHILPGLQVRACAMVLDSSLALVEDAGIPQHDRPCQPQR